MKSQNHHPDKDRGKSKKRPSKRTESADTRPSDAGGTVPPAVAKENKAEANARFLQAALDGLGPHQAKMDEAQRGIGLEPDYQIPEEVLKKLSSRSPSGLSVFTRQENKQEYVNSYLSLKQVIGYILDERSKPNASRFHETIWTQSEASYIRDVSFFDNSIMLQYIKEKAQGNSLFYDIRVDLCLRGSDIIKVLVDAIPYPVRSNDDDRSALACLEELLQISDSYWPPMGKPDDGDWHDENCGLTKRTWNPKNLTISEHFHPEVIGSFPFDLRGEAMLLISSGIKIIGKIPVFNDPVRIAGPARPIGCPQKPPADARWILAWKFDEQKSWHWSFSGFTQHYFKYALNRADPIQFVNYEQIAVIEMLIELFLLLKSDQSEEKTKALVILSQVAGRSIEEIAESHDIFMAGFMYALQYTSKQPQGTAVPGTSDGLWDEIIKHAFDRLGTKATNRLLKAMIPDEWEKLNRANPRDDLPIPFEWPYAPLARGGKPQTINILKNLVENLAKDKKKNQKKTHRGR